MDLNIKLFLTNVTTCNKISLIFSQRLFSFLTESSAELYLKVYIISFLPKGEHASNGFA